MSSPNLLWIFVDQLRWQSLSRNGDPNLETPNIDRLAAEGVGFTRTASPCPVCTPARGAVMTGQYPSTNGIRYLGDLLPPGRPRVADCFREAGYHTSYVGKWHLSSQQNPIGHNEGAEYWVHPLLRGGFEHWHGFELSNHFWRTRYASGDLMWPPIELHGYQTDALTDLSLQVMDDARRSARPWFHVVSFEAPHHGSDQEGCSLCTVGDKSHTRHPAPPEYEAMFPPEQIILRGNVPEDFHAVARSQQAQYCAMIKNLDDNVGRLLDWLDERQLREDTLVVFFSDHGEMGGSHGAFQKCSPFAESLQVPFMLRWPGHLAPGMEIGAPASLVDVFPTCAALCGLAVPPEVQGLDLSPVMRKETPRLRPASLSQWFGNPRYGNLGGLATEWRGILGPSHSYAVYADGRRWLVDDRNDPLQLRNLTGKPEHAALEREMHQLLCAQLQAAGEAPPTFVLAAAP